MVQQTTSGLLWEKVVNYLIYSQLSATSFPFFNRDASFARKTPATQKQIYDSQIIPTNEALPLHLPLTPPTPPTTTTLSYYIASVVNSQASDIYRRKWNRINKDIYQALMRLCPTQQSEGEEGGRIKKVAKERIGRLLARGLNAHSAWPFDIGSLVSSNPRDFHARLVPEVAFQ